MRLAFSILLLVIACAILARAWFEGARPFDVLRQSLLRLPWFLRTRWRLSLLVVVVCLLLPFGSLVAGAVFRPPALRTMVGLAWQGLMTGLLALVAVRIHRGLVMREVIDAVRLEARDRRVVVNVLFVWLAVTLIRMVPVLAYELGLPFGLARVVEAGTTLVTILITATFVLVGPATAFDDPAPWRTAVSSFRSQPFAVLAIVLLTQLMWSIGGLAIAVIAIGGGMSGLLQVLVVTLSVMLIAGVFIVSEHALVIVLTRIRENVYDDTRSRDYNADWH